MNLLPVSLGEIKISRKNDEVLVCYGLGSCIAVCLYDKVNRIGGMFHCVLPASNGRRDDPKYADIGVKVLLEKMFEAGAYRTTMTAKIAGGACVLKLSTMDFDIGSKNIKAVIGHLQDNCIAISGKEVGGSISRTVKLSVSTGAVSVKSAFGREIELC
ncbi:MAG: chemotaxis protein CheD [Planctomycetes bacterium]|nr:chemotaxis protein CheD [Planctomycetota bacterium]